jgi:ATP-dependent RNA helicase DDX21
MYRTFRRGSRFFVGAPRCGVSLLPPPIFGLPPPLPVPPPPPNGGRSFHSSPLLAAAAAPPASARARLDLLAAFASDEDDDDETKRPARLPGAPAAPRGARADGRDEKAFFGVRRGGASADSGARLSAGEEAVAVPAAQSDVESTPLAQFSDLLSAPLLARLARAGIGGLFPVQAATVRAVCGGRDVVVRSRTGSGKTLGFAIPAVALLEAHVAGGARAGRAPRVLVLAPTRELAKQICDEFERVGGVRVAVLYGGAPRGGQAAQLRGGVDVVVGTPGRVADFIEGGELELGGVRVAVLDEADHMLDMGFKEDVEGILKFTPAEKQTMLWSATMPRWVHELSRRFMRAPEFIDMVGDEAAKLPATVTPVAYVVPAAEHEAALKTLLESLAAVGGPPPRVLVFCDTKADVDRLAHMNLQAAGLRVAALHGDVTQAGRERVLADFRGGAVHVVVATDVAARGLDVNDVSHVVQLAAPASVETFTHRAGRTGRAGAAGEAILFVDPRGGGWRGAGAIARALGFAWRVRGVPAPLPHGLLRRGDALTLENAAAARLSASIARNVKAAAGSPLEALAAPLVEAHGALPALTAALGALLVAGGGAKAFDAGVLAAAAAGGGGGGRSLATGAPGRATLRLEMAAPGWAAAAGRAPGAAPLPPAPSDRDLSALIPPPRVAAFAAAAGQAAAELLTRVGAFPEGRVTRVDGWLAAGGGFVCDVPLAALPALKALFDVGLAKVLAELPAEVVEAIVAGAPGGGGAPQGGRWGGRGARAPERFSGGGGGGGGSRGYGGGGGGGGGGGYGGARRGEQGGRGLGGGARRGGESASRGGSYLQERRVRY